MKRLLPFLALLLIVGLAACGEETPQGGTTGSNQPTESSSVLLPTNAQPTATQPTAIAHDGIRPSDALLRKDLQDKLSLRVEKGFDERVTQTVTEFTVILSQTEEKLYTASISVTAQSVYADFTWPVEVKYVKYDQGWVMTDCTWGEYAYQQVRYPSEEEVQQMAQEYVLPDAQQVDTVHKDGIISYLYDSEVSWSEYVKGSCTSEIRWAYNDYYDYWEYRGIYGTSNSSIVLTEDLEGTWEFNDNRGTVAIIKNTTATGFDMQEGIGGEMWHFEYRSAYITGKDGGVLWIELDQEYGNKGITMAIPKYNTEANYVICDFFVGIYDASEYWTMYSSTICNKISKISEYAGEIVAIHVYLDDWFDRLCNYWLDNGSKVETYAGLGTVSKDGWYTVRVPGCVKTIQFTGKDDVYGGKIIDTNKLSVESGHNAWIVVDDEDKGHVFYQELGLLSNGYNVLIVDQEGGPVDNIAVELCYDDMAWISSSNEAGVATFVVEDVYGAKVKILSKDYVVGDEERVDSEGYVSFSESNIMILTVTKKAFDNREEFPGSNAISNTISNGNSSITYRPDVEEEYSWPFIVTSYKGESCIKASNSRVDSSYAILYADVELKAGQAVGFDYIISSEQDADVAYVIVNGRDVYQMSGCDEMMQWKTCYPWVALEDGVYEVAICYIKDDTDGHGDDTIYIDNLRIVDKKDIEVECYIPREAAVENENGEFDYVDIVYSTADGCYHVGSENGPLLLANLLGYTQFCWEDSIQNMASNGEIVKDGQDYYEDLLPYCSSAANSAIFGYCTVTHELAEILKVVAEIKGYEDTEDEWLKICEYYEAYGPNGAQMEDSTKGLLP